MKILLLFSSLLFLKNSYAQQNKPSVSSVYFELGKNGIVCNVYFDKKIQNKNMGFRVGVGSNLAKYTRLISGGIGGYYLFGKTKNFFELGADLLYLSIEEISDDQKGFSWVYPDYSTRGLYASFNFGYRLTGKKMIFRTGISPGIVRNTFIPGGYISGGFIL